MTKQVVENVFEGDVQFVRLPCEKREKKKKKKNRATAAKMKNVFNGNVSGVHMGCGDIVVWK